MRSILPMILAARDPCAKDLKCRFAVLAAALILTAATPSRATPSFMGLGGLPGGAFESHGQAVSADGSVVVGRSDPRETGLVQAFRWTLDGGMVPLGDLPGEPFSSNALGVSGDGSVVVGISAVGNLLWDGFRWTSSNGMEGLGAAGNPTFAAAVSFASAISSTRLSTSSSVAANPCVSAMWSTMRRRFTARSASGRICSRSSTIFSSGSSWSPMTESTYRSTID